MTRAIQGHVKGSKETNTGPDWHMSRRKSGVNKILGKGVVNPQVLGHSGVQDTKVGEELYQQL